MLAPAWGQETITETDLEKEALENFEQGHYETSLSRYNQLLEKYPRDPQFNYYAGVCLVRIGRQYNTAIYQLKLASLGETPTDVYYYIGRAYYHSGNNREAMNYYERFEEVSSREEQRALELEKWKSFIQNNSRPEVTGMERKPPGNQSTSEYDHYITTALELQEQADSARMAASALRTQRDSEGDESGALTREIEALEQNVFDYQLTANDNYIRAREMEKGGQAGISVQSSTWNNENLIHPGSDIPGRGARPYFEQVPDAFYKQREISRILKVSDVTRLYELDEMNRSGNRLMHDAYELERERDQQKVVASAAATQTENKRAILKINRLEHKIADKKLEAFQEFQQINDGKYLVYGSTLDQILVNQDIDKYDLIKQYTEDAKTSHNKALDRRSNAEQVFDQEKKFDTYAEANAYELLAIHNQKMALGTYAGIIPVRAEASIPLNTGSSTQQQMKFNETDPSGGETEPEKTVRENSRISAENEGSANSPILPEPTNPLEEKTNNTEGEPGPPSVKNIEESFSEMPNGHLNEFAVLPTPDYNEMMPIPMDETLPEGIIYKIQVAAYRSSKPQSFFKGLEPITAEHIAYAIRYFAGRFSLYNDAREALKTVKKQGFRDAFIVAYINGITSSVDRARTLEPEYTSRSQGGRDEQEIISTAISSSIHFRLQLGAYSKEISPDLLQTFKYYGGSKKVSYISNNKGLFIYTIGNFSTFEEASAFNDEIKAQGFTEAFIIGVKDGLKIPASEARKLLGMD